MSKRPPSRWRKIPRYAAITLAVLALVAAAYVLLWHWPQQAGEDLGLGPESSQEVRHQVQELENARVATGAQLFLGLGILVGIYLTYRRIRATEKQAETSLRQAEIAQAQVELARRQQTAERFTKAIEQLGNTKMSIRLGGIYALEKIAQDEPEAYFNQFREVLSAFVRERAQEPREPLYEDGEPKRLTRLAPDLQAALAVVGRNPLPAEVDDPARIDWSNSHLEGARLEEAHLEGAHLRSAHLERADLKEAHLERADLKEAHLEGAHLGGAHLEDADLEEAHLEDAFLVEARLEGAFLMQAHLERVFLLQAHLEGAHLKGAHLEGADLKEAHLEGAYLSEAHLEGAYLSSAHLEGAYLWRAHLEGADLLGASYDHETVFPAGFEPSEHGMILVDDEEEDGSDA